MATAKKTVIPPVPVVENFTVTLELSKEEAETILSILQKVGGDPVLSRRKHAQAVERALNAVVVHDTSDMRAMYLYFHNSEVK